MTADIGPTRILVVEDDPLVAASIAQLLEEANFEVDGPHSSLLDGIAAVAEHMPDAAVLDIRLHGHDVSLLADDLEQYGIPFVLCSGLTPRGNMKTCYGDYPFVPKENAQGLLVPALYAALH